MNCEDCEFFDDEDNPRPVVGNCHRYPPGSAGHPLVEKDGWCGEFVAPPEKRFVPEKDEGDD